MKTTNFTKKDVELIKNAISLAFNTHIKTNHEYDNGSYTVHLAHVVDVGYRFVNLVPEEKRSTIIASCYLHDAIEDARLSYNDIVKALSSVEVAEIVRAVTNYTRGRNREERMPPFIYKDIREVEGACFVKLCDRIANIEFGGKTSMYKKEHDHFKSELYREDFKLMFDYIEVLLEL